jgi:hypothetical protein
MPSLQKVKEQIKLYEVDLGDDVIVKASLRPNAITPNRMAEIEDSKSGNSKEAVVELCNFLCEVIVDWDLTWSDANTDKVPLKPDVLADQVPFPFLMQFLVKLGELSQVDPTKPKL